MKVIAVSAPNADPLEVRAFAEEKYADSPVEIYIAPLGTAYQKIGPGYHPSAAFFDAAGERIDTPAGWPGSVS